MRYAIPSFPSQDFTIPEVKAIQRITLLKTFCKAAFTFIPFAVATRKQAPTYIQHLLQKWLEAIALMKTSHGEF